MKKLFTVAFTILLAASVAFAQTTGGSTDKTASGKKPTTTARHGRKANKAKKVHKGGTKVKPELNPQPLPPKTLPPGATTPN
jgi:hypothetical protein